MNTVFVNVPVALELTLSVVRPTPSSGALEVAFTLPDEREVALELMDTQGRSLVRRALGNLTAGQHAAELARAGEIPPGVYLVELEAGQARLVKRAVILR